MTIRYFNPKRLVVPTSEIHKFGHGGALITDPRRSRPHWFDGRFLKAADLNRETNYFLTRQADLAVATGTGVVEGLLVQEKGNFGIHISQGHGMTFDGERVFLPQSVDIRLNDIPLIEELNVQLGLSGKPAPPHRSHSGIYIITLRPLEFTANPTSSYPVDVAGERQMRPGDIVEATAITLVPYASPSGATDSVELRRSQIAHQLFVDQSDYRVPSTTLPLAMVELRRGTVLWVDNNMVRRDMGSVYSDVLGMNFVSRPLRRAHFKQYDEAIEDVVNARLRAGADLKFSAAEYFVSLPSAGRLPTASVDLDERIQQYFPDTMDVEMSIIPEDEMATLIEESLLLPPIPLNQEEEALASNSVMIFLPVPRSIFYSLTRELKNVPQAVRFVGKQIRVSSIKNRFSRKFGSIIPEFKVLEKSKTDDLEKAAWASLAAKERFLWFVRRRNVNYKDEVTGTPVRVLTHEHRDETTMRKQQKEWGLYDDFTHLKVSGSAAADLEMVRLLTIPQFSKHEILMRGVLREFRSKVTKSRKLDEKEAVAVSLKYARRTLGDGIKKIESKIIIGATREAQVKRMDILAESLRVNELDEIAATLADEELDAITVELNDALASKKPEEVRKAIDKLKEDLES